MKNFILSGLVVIALVAGGSASAGSDESNARAFFTKFVAAQNAHDLSQVKSMLWDSPEMLFFSRGEEIRGADAVIDRFKMYYSGTWHLEPDMTKFQAATISNDVVQILVPIVFTRGLPDAESRSDVFLITQTFVKAHDGWRVASILPIANTQIK